MNKKELIKLLVCPKCKGQLEDLPGGFLCPACAMVYPIRNEIPVMLIEQAIPRSEWPDATAGE